MGTKWLYWFEELNSGHNDLVGKKCANLGEMTRLGMRIPPGFAISIDGYERFMAETGAGEEIRRYVLENQDHLKEVQYQIKASQAIRHIIESKEVPLHEGGIVSLLRPAKGTGRRPGAFGGGRPSGSRACPARWRVI